MTHRFSLYPPYVNTSSMLAWCLRPNIVYTYTKPDVHATLADAETLVTQLSYEELLRIFAADSFVFLHDWARVSSYDAAIRRLVVEWGMSYPKSAIEKIRILTAPDSSTLFRMSAATGTMTLSLIGYDIAVTDEFDDEIKHKIPFLPTADRRS